MKTAESKPAAKQAAKTEQPFFRKGGGMFVNETANEHGSFFSSGRNSFSHIQHKPIQAKLTIGRPNDKYEQEADHVADKVVQRWSKDDAAPSYINTGIQSKTVQSKPVVPIATVSPMVQARCASCDQEEKLQKKEEEHEAEAMHGKLQKKPIFESNARAEDQVQRRCAGGEAEESLQKKANSSSAQTASPSVESSLSSYKGSGSSLPASTRTQMESSIGADFSGVKIHNDSGAAQLSNDLNAQAFTHGNDIYFNSGKYDTSSSEGKHLLAHELTHTVQQGASMYRKENQAQTNTSIQKKAPAAVPSAPVSSEVVDISKGTFSPSDNVKKEIEDKQSREGLDVRIKAGAFAEEGIIKVAKKGESYHSVKQAYLQLKNPWLQKINALALRIDIKNNIVTGLVTIKGRGSDVSGWLAEIKKAESEIGMGFHFSDKIPLQNNITNKLENGTLSLGFKDFTIIIGGFFELNLNLALENMNTPVFDGSATVTLKGAEGKVNVDNKYKGKLGGSGSLTITGFKGFSGSVEVKYDAETGATDAHGKAEYSGDKLSGSIDLIATDELTAKNFTKDAIKAAGGKDKIQDASAPAPVPAPTGDKKRALAGAGQLQFNLTNWFAGTVNVVVDAEGHITVIGKIAPPAEITLFKQKDWDKELLKFEAKAYYGIPVVGNLNLFANISLHAIAKLGPAKICNIEILGTYSTDPEVQKNIQIAGSINISGYAGLRLRAEGGAGIEILSHDLKFGVGIQADIGVQAYADARPTIGWRDPGEFYISGTLEMVAQPMLGLGGDFFIEIETPWWSPLSDKKWTWPLFAKQWPLTDPIGINATLKDYVLGSGNVPEIEFKKPEFDASKFMTNMVDDNLPDKSGGAGGGKGEFKDDGSAKKPDVADKKPKKQPEGKPAAPGKKDAPGKPAKAKPDPKAAAEAGNIFKAAGSQLTKIKDPVSKADLRFKLNDIQKAVGGIAFDIKLDNDKWVVSSTAKGINNPKPVKYKAILTNADKKGDFDPIKIHSVFDTNGEHHELNTKEGTNELIMSSHNPVLLSSHPDKDVRDAYTEYLKVIEDTKAKGPTARKEKANQKILIIISKIKAAKMASAPGASAPGIGDVELHKNQTSKLRKSGIPVWFMESEHVIPRAVLSAAFEALNQIGIPAGKADYDNMHTVLIYKGAAKAKTAGQGDLSLISAFKKNVANKRENILANPGKSTKFFSDLAQAMDKLINDFGKDARDRTKKGISEENKQNGSLRGPQNHPELPNPDSSKVDQACNDQISEVNHYYTIRLTTFINQIKKDAKNM